MVKAVIFDLFHTLTAPETEWSDLPWTSDVLGISRADWYRALTENSCQRLVGEISDPVEIVRLVAPSVDPGISEDLIARAASFRTQRFIRVLSSIPAHRRSMFSANYGAAEPGWVLSQIATARRSVPGPPAR